MRQFKSFFQSALILGILLSATTPALADTMHFLNGKIVRGKLDRVTGDIIEFRESTNYGNKVSIHRIELTNRHDIVEVRGDKRYFGEIVYFDRFKLDIRTTTGLIKLNRMKITNVVVGTPAEQPVSHRDVMPMAPTATGNMPTTKPMVHFPAGNEPLPGTTGMKPYAGSYTDDEDWDSMR